MFQPLPLPHWPIALCSITVHRSRKINGRYCISTPNKENLIAEIDQFDSALDQLRDALVADDRDKLEEMFRLSTQRRAAFDKKLPE